MVGIWDAGMEDVGGEEGQTVSELLGAGEPNGRHCLGADITELKLEPCGGRGAPLWF